MYSMNKWYDVKIKSSKKTFKELRIKNKELRRKRMLNAVILISLK